MRYWLFDGNDVIGPLTPQCIAQRVGFSPSFLVCPEQESENERAWKPASSFEDFNHPAEAVIPGKQVAENALPAHAARQSSAATTACANTATVPAARRIHPILTLSAPQTDAPRVLAARPSADKESFVFSAIPISQVEKDEIILPLRSPRRETTASAKVSSDSGAKTSGRAARTQPSSSAFERVPARQTQSPLPLRPLHSLPVLGVSESRLPLVPEETEVRFPWHDVAQKTPAYATPSAIAVQRQEERLKQWKVSSVALSTEAETLPLPDSVLAPLTGFSNTIEELVPLPRPISVKQAPARVTVPAQKIITPVAKKTPVTSAARQVRAAQDPEEELPVSLKKSSTRSTRNILFGILCAFLALACLGVGYQIFPYLKIKGVPRAQAATTAKTTVPITGKTPSKMQSIPTPPPPQAITVPLAQEEAVRIVKEHLLPDGRGTVENYLNHLYSNQLAQGYRASWSAEPLYKSSYVVRYRLAKTRTEPVIYVFQADTATGQLTGALNNITLDLVGKV